MVARSAASIAAPDRTRRNPRALSSALATTIVSLIVLLVVVTAISGQPFVGPLPATAGALFLVMMGIALPFLRRAHPFGSFGAANMVTTIRAALVAVVAALIGDVHASAAVAVVLVTTVVIALDGIDGWLARRTGMASAFGARFDMEIDALLIACLAILTWQHEKAGAWIVLAGVLRYAFVAGSWVWPWLAAPLPDSLRRKAACIVQIVAFQIALLPIMDAPLSAWLCAAALALLVWSFAVDTSWLRRQAEQSA